jgi:predicted DNA-binding transcriptional regulator AlpA
MTQDIFASTQAHQASAPPRMLTIAEVAERLAVKRAWCYDHAAEMGAVKLMGLLRFPENRLTEWIDSQRLTAKR